MFLDFSLISVLLLLIIFSLHTYLFYPLLIKFLSLFFPGTEKGKASYNISIIISAYNEEKVISQRITNIANQKYDLSKIEVLVGSDNSDDLTNEILRNLQIEYKWLKVFIFTNRRGKASVINDLVKHAQCEILIFTDANTEFDDLALQRLCEGFSNDNIGGVCGRLILDETIENKLISIEETRYWKYETFIKKAEGRCGVLIGANGGIFAIRQNLFEEIPADSITDDFYISLSVLKNNRKFIYKSDAIAYEKVVGTISSEYNRKVRFSATNYQTLFHHSKNLLFNQNILLVFAFWSHKVLRWFFPFFLFGIFILSFFLKDVNIVFLILFYSQIIFYVIGIFGYLFSLFKIRISFFSVIYFFIISNIALIIGFIKFLRGKQTSIWQSSPR